MIHFVINLIDCVKNDCKGNNFSAIIQHPLKKHSKKSNRQSIYIYSADCFVNSSSCLQAHLLFEVQNDKFGQIVGENQSFFDADLIAT